MKTPDNTQDKDPTKDILLSMVNLRYSYQSSIRYIRVVATEGYSCLYIIPALFAIVQKYNYHYRMEEKSIDYIPEDPEFKFFQFSRPEDHYIDETIFDTELNLYASPDYLNEKGEPRELADLHNHDIILPHKSDVLSKIGKVKYPPIYYKKANVNVDSLTMGDSFAENGFGIMCATDKTVAMAKLKLAKINKLENTYKTPFVLSTHKKVKDDPIAEQFRTTIKSMFN